MGATLLASGRLDNDDNLVGGGGCGLRTGAVTGTPSGDCGGESGGISPTHRIHQQIVSYD